MSVIYMTRYELEREVERLRAFWSGDEPVARLERERDEANEALAACQAQGGWYKDRVEAALEHIQMRADFGDELDPDDLVKILTGGRE